MEKVESGCSYGFQSAKQLYNRLHAPKRMKKDPLEQTKINSFFVKKDKEGGT